MVFDTLRLVGDRADGSPPSGIHIGLYPVLAVVCLSSAIPGVFLWRRRKGLPVVLTGLLIYAPCAALALVVIWAAMNARMP
jgi:hypothetical protein